jgi:hypothetical protein
MVSNALLNTSDELDLVHSHLLVQRMKSLLYKIIIHACQLIHRDLNKASNGQNVKYRRIHDKLFTDP